VARSGNTEGELTVYYSLGGTAVNGQDYLTLPDSVTIPSGSATADITVTPVADAGVTPADTVLLTLIAQPNGAPTYGIGSPSSATVTITEIIPPTTNQPPVVSIVAPRDGVRFRAPARITLIARASDPDGTVAQVEFFSGTNSLGMGTLLHSDRNDGSESESKNPRHDKVSANDSDDNEDESSDSHSSSIGYYVLKLRNVAAGTYTVTAVATDNLGATTTSAPVKITVVARRRSGDD
jgi:hypothetical protein